MLNINNLLKKNIFRDGDIVMISKGDSGVDLQTTFKNLINKGSDVGDTAVIGDFGSGGTIKELQKYGFNSLNSINRCGFYYIPALFNASLLPVGNDGVLIVSTGEGGNDLYILIDLSDLKVYFKVDDVFYTVCTADNNLAEMSGNIATVKGNISLDNIANWSLSDSPTDINKYLTKSGAQDFVNLLQSFSDFSAYLRYDLDLNDLEDKEASLENLDVYSNPLEKTGVDSFSNLPVLTKAQKDKAINNLGFPTGFINGVINDSYNSNSETDLSYASDKAMNGFKEELDNNQASITGDFLTIDDNLSGLNNGAARNNLGLSSFFVSFNDAKDLANSMQSVTNDSGSYLKKETGFSTLTEGGKSLLRDALGISSLYEIPIDTDEPNSVFFSAGKKTEIQNKLSSASLMSTHTPDFVKTVPDQSIAETYTDPYLFKELTRIPESISDYMPSETQLSDQINDDLNIIKTIQENIGIRKNSDDSVYSIMASQLFGGQSPADYINSGGSYVDLYGFNLSDSVSNTVRSYLPPKATTAWLTSFQACFKHPEEVLTGLTGYRIEIDGGEQSRVKMVIPNPEASPKPTILLNGDGWFDGVWCGDFSHNTYSNSLLGDYCIDHGVTVGLFHNWSINMLRLIGILKTTQAMASLGSTNATITHLQNISAPVSRVDAFENIKDLIGNFNFSHILVDSGETVEEKEKQVNSVLINLYEYFRQDYRWSNLMVES